MSRISCALLLAAVLVASGCASPDTSSAPQSSAAAPGAAARPWISGKAPRGTIVTLEPTTPQEFPLPEGPAIMDQWAKQFVPDLLLVRVGQPVEFRNSEDTPHNVNVQRMPTGTEIFNVSTPPGQKYVHTFERPGQYAVACDIHPGMLATVVATTTPLVAVTDDRGVFQFTDVAPGEYTVRWTGDQNGEKKVTVESGRTDVAVP